MSDSPNPPNSGPLDDEPLSDEARRLYSQSFAPRYYELQQRIFEIPLMILVWGPGPQGGKLYEKRVQIRNQLRKLGHAALFSEEIDSISNMNIPSDVRELQQAKLVDFIVVLQASPGSTAEVHDFGRFLELGDKMLIFIDEHHIYGYSYTGLLTTLSGLFNNVVAFKHPEDVEQCFLLGKVLERVRLLQFAKVWQMRER